MHEINDLNSKEIYQKILVECPTCQAKKVLKIPPKIINQAKQLTTISVPSGTACEHGFQAFLDKNFKVRGYQKVDFEFSHMEFSEYDPTAIYDSRLLLQEIITILRSNIDDKEILGNGIFTIDGNILYSSLPTDNLSSIIREIKARDEMKLISFRKLYLELQDNQKICFSYLKVKDVLLVLVLFFSEIIKFDTGRSYMDNLIQKIKELEL